MDFESEFKSIKNSFRKVQGEIKFLTGDVVDNFTNFSAKHRKISNEFMHLTEEVDFLKKKVKFHVENSQEIRFDFAKEICKLKKVAREALSSHDELRKALKLISENKKQINTIKERSKMNELEVMLLKQELLEIVNNTGIKNTIKKTFLDFENLNNNKQVKHIKL